MVSTSSRNSICDGYMTTELYIILYLSIVYIFSFTTVLLVDRQITTSDIIVILICMPLFWPLIMIELISEYHDTPIIKLRKK